MKKNREQERNTGRDRLRWKVVRKKEEEDEDGQQRAAMGPHVSAAAFASRCS